jgi:sacsin
MGLWAFFMYPPCSVAPYIHEYLIISIVSQGTAFGQSESLPERLRSILEQYPEGSQIKELIQNADDAGAKSVDFVLDLRNHATEKLLCPALGLFQGPALLAYNDARFEERDFKSICSLGKSRKKHELGKTGRFGIG